MNYCYCDTLQRFFEVDKDQWLEQMKENIKVICNEEAKPAQIESWKDCFDVLRKEFNSFAKINPSVHIIFEYVLRYTSKKRPDVLIVSEDKLAILEFKRKNDALLNDIAQTEGYTRYLYNYHSETTNKMKKILPLLVLTYADNIVAAKHNGSFVYVVSKDHLADIIEKEMCNLIPHHDISSWTNAEFKVLPSVIEAARAKRNNTPLPEYEIVRKAGINDAKELLLDYIIKAKNEKRHILAIVNGVPGAGKTLLGLDLAFYPYNDDSIKAKYMSGNGPLVSVLQDALGIGSSNSFVTNIHTILDQYTTDGANDSNFNVCIFDEGQRTWTAEQRAKKHKIRPQMSESSLLVEMMNHQTNWGVILLLVGDGQQINSGEETDLKLWNDALSQDWNVLCPPSMDKQFQNCAIIDEQYRDKLTLTNSIRSNCAMKFGDSINSLIAGDLDNAKRIYNNCTKFYTVYITRDLDKAKKFCIDYYEGDTEKKYGLLASSQSFVLPGYGVDNRFENTKNTYTYPAKWYNAQYNDPSHLSCCWLEKPVTEFGCQGLEIDMPIVCWEKDFLWNGNGWILKASYTDKNNKKSVYTPKGLKADYRKNAYRVLLTRGRDGMIVYIPDENEFTETYNALKYIGFKELK